MSNTGPLSISINTSNTVTSVPQIAPGTLAVLRLVGIEQKSTDKGNYISWSYELTAPTPKVGGGVINPGEFGSKVFENTMLYGKDTAPGEIPTWALTRISEREDALLGTGDPGNAKGKPVRPNFGPDIVPSLIGKTLVAKFKSRKDDPNATEIDRVFFQGDIAA